ncbi:MAG: DUF2911 domain-containing protein [Bacteroidota bacterium]
MEHQGLVCKKSALFVFILSLFISEIAFSQLDAPPVAGNPRAKITEEVGITDITITYGRPDVNGREGKLWGPVVPNGFSTNNFITGKPTSPWRAGANDNTTITFEHEVKFEGKPVKAGTYGLSMALYLPDSVIVILSSSADAWGSFSYEAKNDVLRTTVKPTTLDKSVEYLKYEFINHKEKECTVALQWEKLSIPFKIEVDVENIVVNKFREQLKGYKGFSGVNLMQASQYCVNKGINLDEALVWATKAVAAGNGGQKSFATLNNLANAYAKMNRNVQADSVMNEAIPMASAAQIGQYARQLIALKRADKALDVLNAAKTKFGEVFPISNSLIYAYSAKGDFKNALLFAQKAIEKVPNPGQKPAIEALIVKLKEGKDIN